MSHHQDQAQPTKESVITSHQNAARILYVMQEGDSPFCKVGVTKNEDSLQRRLQNLQAGNPRLLSVVCTWSFDEDGQAFATEQQTFKDLAEFAPYAGSEWLALSPTDVRNWINGQVLEPWGEE